VETLRKLGALSPFFIYPESPPDLNALADLGVFEKNRLPIIKLLELQNEYVRLFINSLPEVPCTPYASVYLEGRCMGESTVEILELYQKYGLTTDEMPDHIAVELEFLSYLDYLIQGSKDIETDKDVESDLALFIKHLYSWAPIFFKRVEEHDKTGFYRAVARAAFQALDNTYREA
jgi:TorA maturation chaperone TorD